MKAIRLEVTREELFRLAFFIGYAKAKLENDRITDAMHKQASDLLEILITAEPVDEDVPPVVIDAMGTDPKNG